MNCSTLGFPVLRYLLEFAQTHVHWVSDVIHPSYPLSVGSSYHVVKVLELQLQPQSFQWIFKVDFLYDWLVCSPCCPRNSQESSPASQFESIIPSALSLLYGPTLTSIHDYWKNHSFNYMDLVMSLLFNMQSRFVTAFLPRSKHLLTLWLQSPSAVISEPHYSSLTPSVPAPLVSLLFLEHPFHSCRAFAFAASSD